MRVNFGKGIHSYLSFGLRPWHGSTACGGLVGEECSVQSGGTSMQDQLLC